MRHCEPEVLPVRLVLQGVVIINGVCMVCLGWPVYGSRQYLNTIISLLATRYHVVQAIGITTGCLYLTLQPDGCKSMAEALPSIMHKNAGRKLTTYQLGHSTWLQQWLLISKLTFSPNLQPKYGSVHCRLPSPSSTINVQMKLSTEMMVGSGIGLSSQATGAVPTQLNRLSTPLSWA